MVVHPKNTAENKLPATDNISVLAFLSTLLYLINMKILKQEIKHDRKHCEYWF